MGLGTAIMTVECVNARLDGRALIARRFRNVHAPTGLIKNIVLRNMLILAFVSDEILLLAFKLSFSGIGALRTKERSPSATWMRRGGTSTGRNRGRYTPAALVRGRMSVGKFACMMVNDQIRMYYVPRRPLEICPQGSATMTSACAGATAPKGASTLPRGHRPAPRQ